MNLTIIQIMAIPLAVAIGLIFIYAVFKLIAMAIFSSWWEAQGNWQKRLIDNYIKTHGKRKGG
jgi:hypothetical protein